MKGKNRLKILEFVERSAQLVEDMFFIFTLPYGTSYSRMNYLIEKRRRRDEALEEHFGTRQAKRRFDDLIYRLKKDGLVCGVKKEKGIFLGLTNKGKSILEKFRADKKESLPIARYSNQDDKTLKIIIFDIPEQEKRKRDWLRSALKNLKFEMLQKSVWAGKTKLPGEFMEDLKRMNLLSCVEIFAVNRSGSLNKI